MRYSRQELVIGKSAQRKLSQAKIAIVGIGALGSTAAELLVRAGVAQLTIIDRDRVDLSNMPRQTLYTDEDISRPKAEAAYARLKLISPKLVLNRHVDELSPSNALQLLDNHSLILDGTDNMYVRFLINDCSRKLGIPWVYGASIREVGSVMAITKDTPCFACVFPTGSGHETCETVGVLNTATTMTAALQVHRAIRLLTGKPAAGRLIHIDLEAPQLTISKVNRRPDCPACRGEYLYLEGKDNEEALALRCSSLYHFRLSGLSLPDLASRLKRSGPVISGDTYLFFRNISVYSDGRVLVRANSERIAKAAIAKYIGT